ncbi:MAG: iron-containing alcohol dehydrogenase [Treponema sp.]|jgi:alcohol dehydrogenase class IV|nr:iron-containing alcohol dehydrogenase [Treponema sp.]
MNFSYLMSTRVIAGAHCVYENRAALAGLGKKALIVTGRNSAKANGAYADLVKALEANGQAHTLFDRVMSNPTVDCAYETAAMIRNEGCDFVIGIGGGSPMDTAKAAAAIAVNPVEKAAVYEASYTKALPLAEIATTAGTGSEVTQYAILTNNEGTLKKSIGAPALFPRVAFLDARYMLNMGRAVTVNTAIDALSHAVEGMLSVRASALSDTLAKESIAIIAGCFGELLSWTETGAVKPPLPQETREKLLFASTLAGMVIAQTGTTSVHAMGYEFTLAWGTDHGRANGLLLEAFLRFIEAKEKTGENGPPRIPAICAALGRGCGEPVELDQFAGILNRLLGAREKADAGQIEAWTERAFLGKKNGYIAATREELGRIFTASVG